MIQAVGAAGALAGAGALFDDTVTLESVPGGPYTYEHKQVGEDEYRSASDMELGNRPSEDSIARESLFNGHTGVAPADWRLNSQPDSDEYVDSDEGRSNLNRAA